MTLPQRARELAMFFDLREDDALERLSKGFAHHHAGVAESFRSANPKTDDELLDWYRTTPSYCWELSAYHADLGFNYDGMCYGIARHLRTMCGERARVLCLGDGIGDLTLMCLQHGLDPFYHDLLGSVTADFAAFRFKLYDKTPWLLLSETWEPLSVEYSGHFDAIIALDFFEHMPNVEAWVRRCFGLLKSDGLFLAQNAFGVGDPEHGGSIPCHLSRNNKYEQEWDPLLDSVGFARTDSGNWRRKQ